jgi:ABC-2 type transport system ATP-binding protein
MKKEILLSVEDVIKKYGDYTALNKVNISVPKSSIYGLLGPNGAGKTTLMRIINQITAPDHGTIIFNGEKLNKNHIKDIGYLPEERGLYKKMKVGEQALYLAQLKGMSYHKAKENLKYWFEKLEITHWWSKRVEELSKGMAQKIQFVVTVIHKPKLLIFDEPFSGFDPINAAIIRKEILQLRDNGTTIIFSTHRMESVEEICDHIALINNSKTILEGPIDKIKDDFQSNTYEVILKEKNLVSSQEFDILSKNENNYKIKINDNFKLNQTIDIINKNFNIISFKKETPSVEGIFIKSINNE